jgi:hypothetical protein
MAHDTATPRPRTTRANRDRRREGSHFPETAAAIPGQGISAVRFARSLLQLSRSRLEHQAAGLKTRRASPEDDVAWWEATMAVNRALRRRGTGHEAAMAAHLASQAVLAAATQTGLALGADVTAVARAAGEVARALVAGDLRATAYLTRDWEDFLIPPADPPSPAGAAGGRGSTRSMRSSRRWK